jgi:hypothetical protein
MRIYQVIHFIPINLSFTSCGAFSGSPEGSVLARLIAAKSTGESVPVAIATVSFRNDLSTAVNIRSYQIRWPGGAFFARPESLHLPAHSTTERKVRIDLASGNLATLLDHPCQAEIELAWSRSD